MALIVEAVGRSGVVERVTVEGGKAAINAQPGITYRILDAAGQPVNVSATVERLGDHLIIKGLPDEATVQLTDFFFVCTPNDPCSLDLDGLGGARGETINQLSEPVAALADGSFVMHAPASMVTPTAPEAEFSAKPALAGLALLGLAGGGGGGSGGGGGQRPDPGSTTVTSPALDAEGRLVTNDVTPVIAGTAQPGTQITVTLDIPGTGPVTFNTIANGNGVWRIDTGTDPSSPGSMPPGGLPPDALTEVRVLTAAANESYSYQLSIDTNPPPPPVIDPITGNDIITDDEARNPDGSPIIVQGSAEAGATVVVSWHGKDQVTTADSDGRWSVTFDGLDIPRNTSENPLYVVSAVATDLAGNTGDAGTRTVNVVTTIPSSPIIDDVAGDNIINIAESDAGITLQGTTEAGTQVLVTFSELFSNREATIGSDGTSWSVEVTDVELAQLQDGETYQVTAYASDGIIQSAVATSESIRVDLTPPAAPTISEPVADDNIVNETEAANGVTINGINGEPGGTVEVSWGDTILAPVDVRENGTWTAVFAPEQIPGDGNHTLSVTAFDPAGNASPPKELLIRVDMTVVTPTFALASDTGSSGSDGITMNGAINVSGLEGGATWEYSVNGGTNWTAGAGTSFTLPAGTHAEGDVQVRQTDAAGNVSDARSNPVGITVDNTPPPAPILTFAPPSTVNVGGLEAGATWEYSTNGGSTWSNGTGSSFVLPDGDYAPNTVQVRQTDVAGNQGNPGENAGPIIVDIIPPNAPTIALAEDTGSSASDGITRNGTVNVGGLETGATWEYSTDSGSTWTTGTGTSFVLTAGTYATDAVQVRQTDVAGNPGAPGSNASPITVDTTLPDAPSATVLEDTVNVAGIEADAIWQYSINGGTTWADGIGSSFTLAPGTHAPSTIQVHQTDVAGNTSDPWINPNLIIVLSGGESGDNGGPFALMSLDLVIPEFEPGDGRTLSIDKLLDDSDGAPGIAVVNGGAASDATPVLTLTLSDVLGDGESIRLLRDGATVATTSEPGTSWILDDGVGIITEGQHSYTAELVSAGNVITTSDPHLYNFQMI